jgi:type IV pilus assembly protein PilV
MLKPHRHRAAPAALQRGVGLIEVLIAVLVLSIGMLGMAGLQTWSLRTNESAMQRGMAVVQAYAIADVMRADRVVAVGSGFNLGLDDDASDLTGGGFAETAVADWRASLQESLGPDASGAVDCDGAICDITVRWDDSRAVAIDGDDGDTVQQIVVQVEL